MDAIISLVVEKKAGIVGRLASGLTDYGLNYERHYVYGSEPERCRLDLEAEGAESSPDRISDGLGRIDGVIEVVKVQLSTGEPYDSEERDDYDDEPQVNDIVWAYPRILSLVREYEGKLSADERVHRLTKLGAQVGRRLGRDHPRLEGAKTVESALRDALLPALKSIAVGDVHASNLRVAESIFVRQNLDMMFLSREEPGGCCFLTGLIGGMLNQAPHLPRIAVTETKCRESGDPVCYFEARKA